MKLNLMDGQNEAQKQAITSTEGYVRGIAGSGFCFCLSNAKEPKLSGRSPKEVD